MPGMMDTILNVGLNDYVAEGLIRAVDYRRAGGTAVNIQTMVFGNMGGDLATGVAMSRNASTGEPELERDFLINAQGEEPVPT